MRFITGTPAHDLTYADVFLVPSRSSLTSRFAVDLTPGDGTGTTVPIVASNMNSVTGPRMAAALARRGGLAVLTQDHDIDATAEAIAWVKAQPVGLQSAHVAAVTDTVAEVLRRLPASSGQVLAITDADGAFVGAIPAERLGQALPDARVSDLLHARVQTVAADAVGDARSQFQALQDVGLEAAPVVDASGALVGIASRKGALRSEIYRPALDDSGRLRVAAAVGVNGEPAVRATALADAGADVIVVDTAHGHQDSAIRAVEAVRDALPAHVPVVAGNVVTASAVTDLVRAGAGILKVGVGPGAMCTTRMMTAVGRPQFSAVLETAQAARELGAHVWADGGVRYPRDVALALAAGASSVMIGSWFAGTVEAPGEVQRDADGSLYKESWGMASTKAVEARFRHLDPFDYARKLMFAEGISGSRMRIDPQRPSVEDLLDMITTGVRSSMTYAGAADLREFHERAQVGIQSAAGYEEGKALPVSW